MEIISQDIYIKAWNFASKAHIGQTMPGTDVAYINHIGNVAMEILVAVSLEPVKNPNLAVQCALLHDVIEDTDVTYQDVKAEFGDAVAAGVSALTKDTSLPTKQEQMQDSLNRILVEPKSVWMVKLADRITNLQPPPHYWTVEKIIKYRDEAVQIQNHLGDAHAVLSKRLSSKIDHYQKYTTE